MRQRRKADFPEKGDYTTIARSYDDPNIPLDPNVVKAHCYLFGVIYRKHDDKNTNMTFFHWINPNVAAFITNAIVPRVAHKLVFILAEKLQKGHDGGHLNY